METKKVEGWLRFDAVQTPARISTRILFIRPEHISAISMEEGGSEISLHTRGGVRWNVEDTPDNRLKLCLSVCRDVPLKGKEEER